MWSRPDSLFEDNSCWRNISPVAGVDEVGVGALAGPVIAAAVILPRNISLPGLNDSKLLSTKRREELFGAIQKCAVDVGVGQVEVDRLNVYWAAMLARQRTVEALRVMPCHVFIDGKRRIAGLTLAQTPILEGDRLHLSISAASIIAKISPDRIKEELGAIHPRYGFERHKGYGTPAHITALNQLGPLAVHRHSFAPVAATEHRQSMIFPWPSEK